MVRLLISLSAVIVLVGLYTALVAKDDARPEERILPRPTTVEELRARQAFYCDALAPAEQTTCYVAFYRDATGEDEGGNPVAQFPPGTPGRPPCAVIPC